MTRRILCIKLTLLMLLFAIAFLSQPSFGDHWAYERKMWPGSMNDTYVLDWVNNSYVICGGKDFGGGGSLRKFNIKNGNQEAIRTWDNHIPQALAIPQHHPFYVVYGLSGYTSASMRYTDDLDWRGSFGGDAGGMTAFTFQPGTHIIATGARNGWINIWRIADKDNLQQGRHWRSESRGIYALTGLIVSGGPGGWVRNLLVADGDWNIDSWRAGGGAGPFIQGVSSHHAERVIALDASADSDGFFSYFVSGSEDNAIYSWKGSSLKNHARSAGDINSVDVGPGRKFVASGSNDNYVRIYHYNNNSGHIGSLKFQHNTGDDVNVVKFSPNGYYLAAGTDSGLYIYRTWQSPAAPTRPDEPEAAPMETTLLSNFPNPFNPETWIPYQLAKPAEVKVSIHMADGTLVRTLALGQMPAGVYKDKDRAAYWDGKNEQGESVASGVYFYTLKAGDFFATKKLLIRK